MSLVMESRKNWSSSTTETNAAFGTTNSGSSFDPAVYGNVVAPACEYSNLRQRVPPGQCQYPVNFGLGPDANSVTVRQECRRGMSVRVNLGLCRACYCGRERGCSCPQIGTRLRIAQPRRTCDRDKGSSP